MRGTRWLLLAAILVILGGTGVTYYFQKRSVLAHATPRPPALPPDTNATAKDWEWSRTDAGRPVVKIRARSFRQVADTNKFELGGVQLSLYQKDTQSYDLVKSEKAEFNQSEGKLFSNGDVEITLDVPVQGKATHPLTSIRSSGITFESKTGKAITERGTHFIFQNGEGTSVGASYDPATRELHLIKDVVLNLQGAGPNSQPMKVEATELVYKEAASQIWLSPPTRLTRSQTVVDAGVAVINLKDRAIQNIDAQQARGVDHFPNRELEYSADSLKVIYNDAGEMEKMTGVGHAHLLSRQAGGQTTMSGDYVDLNFVTEENEAVLTHAVANGNGFIESKPAPAKKGKTPETRILRAGYIDMFMRPGGKELDKVETQTPGDLEFTPNEPDQHRRLLHGERINITYGENNQVQSFQSTKVNTETFPAKTDKAKNQASSKTSSVNMTADFDEDGQMKRIRQWEDFTYQEGDRRARAVTAFLENDKNVMDLQTSARVWDPTGSTDADHLVIDQKTGNYAADGHVNTSHVPDKDKKKGGSDLLDGDDPLLGTAARMTSVNRNKLVHYEGNAVLWQASDRIQADRIDIDREKHNVIADGNVVTQFLDKPDPNAPATAPKPAPVFTVVRAPHMVYTDSTRLAYYSGGPVTLVRPGLSVKGRQLRAFLAAKEDPKKPGPAPAGTPATPARGESRLEKAFVDDDVEIVESKPVRKRTGTGIHAEYYTEDDRIVLRGGDALLVDTVKGNTKGRELTYYTSDDRLVVTGEVEKPVKSHLKRKK